MDSKVLAAQQAMLLSRYPKNAVRSITPLRCVWATSFIGVPFSGIATFFRTTSNYTWHTNVRLAGQVANQNDQQIERIKLETVQPVPLEVKIWLRACTMEFRVLNNPRAELPSADFWDAPANIAKVIVGCGDCFSLDLYAPTDLPFSGPPLSEVAIRCTLNPPIRHHATRFCQLFLDGIVQATDLEYFIERYQRNGALCTLEEYLGLTTEEIAAARQDPEQLQKLIG